MLCEVPEGSDVFNGINIFFGQKHLNAVFDALIYLSIYFAGGGAGGGKKEVDA